RSEDGIKWVGMWHALLGVKNGLEPGCPPEIKDVMMEGNNKRSVPKPDAKSIETFMRYMLSDSKRDDIDFVKIDFCGPLLTYYAGADSEKVTATFPETAKDAVPNPSASAALYSRIFQKVVAEDFNGLINCNWHTPQFIFNSGENNVGRCSGDYRLGDLERAKSHLFYSYNTIPWIGQTYWGDHDMFHSSDKVAGEMMAISKAISGGPIYLSDKHEELVPENIMPLCYEDGLLIRPLAPASPLEGDLFLNPEDKALYRAMAPLANKSVAFVLYNFHEDTNKDPVELSSSITPEDYCSASAMIQPYPGDWKLPEEGLLVYDFTTKSAEKMGKEYKVTLKGFSDRLLQVSPIKNGWSVIGRIDKYLSAPTVEIVSCDKTQLKIILLESGPFAIWLEKGTPKAKGITFKDMGNGVFVSNLKVKAEALEVSITR
ncbi:MAG: hypothetical protein GQ563_01005, partial [Desulfuromusa sp.]|nr:hypothetical protein [Desulfuromusa sp.]